MPVSKSNMLYWYGNEFTSNVGNWSLDGWTFDKSGTPYTSIIGTLTKGSISINGTQTTNGPAKALCTANAVGSAGATLKCFAKSGTTYSGFNGGVNVTTSKSYDVDLVTPIEIRSTDTSDLRQVTIPSASYIVLLLGSTFANRSVEFFGLWIDE